MCVVRCKFQIRGKCHPPASQIDPPCSSQATPPVARPGPPPHTPRMGIPSDLRGAWTTRSRYPLIPSPEEERVANARRCTQEGVRAGAKAAAVACVASAVPTLIGVRVIPWAKANLNYTAQALIISAASIAAYFITADKTILECARKNSLANFDKTQ